MTIQNVLALLGAIVDKMEEMSIERDALMGVLHKAKFTPDDIQQIWTDAKSDPEIRSKARQAFAETRRQLTEEGISSLLAKLPPETPGSGPVH